MENTILTKFSKLTSPTLGQTNFMNLKIPCTEDRTSLQRYFCQKMHNQSNHEETTGKFKLRDILQNNCPVLLKNIKVKKHRKGCSKLNIKKCSKLKEIEEMMTKYNA